MVPFPFSFDRLQSDIFDHGGKVMLVLGLSYAWNVFSNWKPFYTNVPSVICSCEHLSGKFSKEFSGLE